MDIFQILIMDPYGQEHIRWSKGAKPVPEGWEMVEVINLSKDEDPENPLMLWHKLVTARKAIDKLPKE